MKLNLGHTFGHGVEAMSDFTVSHGCAVAIGTAIISRAAAKYGFCSRECAERIEIVLKSFDLPTNTENSALEISRFALSDKKRSGGSVKLIIPSCIGSCFIRPTSIEEIESMIQAGL
jgi:3-dehydroquinate synthase